MAIHPRKDEQGKVVTIKQPHTPTPLISWADPRLTAIEVPGGPIPASQQRVRLASPHTDGRLPAYYTVILIMSQKSGGHHACS